MFYSVKYILDDYTINKIYNNYLLCADKLYFYELNIFIYIYVHQNNLF